MNQIFHHQLTLRRDAALHEAAKKMEARDGADIEPLLKKISIYNSILNSLPDQKQKKKDIIAATLVWLICMSLVGLAWGIRLKNTNVVLQIESESLNVEVAAPLEWSDGVSVGPNHINIEKMDILQLTGTTTFFDFKGGVSGELTGREIRLAEISQSSGGELLIKSLDGELIEISSKNTSFSGKFTLSGDTKISVKRKVDKTANNYSVTPKKGPESIIFRSPKSGATPAVLRFSLLGELELPNMNIRTLNLLQNKSIAPGERQFASGINSGSILLSDISETINLRKSDQLSVSGVNGRLTELRVKDIIKFRFEGEVDQILKGFEGYTQDLRPNYLQYIYHQRPLSMFFSAVAFLWGILWSTKKLLLY